MRIFKSGCLAPEHSADVCPLQRSCSWQPVNQLSPSPLQRSQHTVCLQGRLLYLYGGRGIKGTRHDFWTYNIDDGIWTEVEATGDLPPPLEGHTIVEHRGLLYMFGGEMGFASATEVPMWIYDPKLCVWYKKCKSANAPCGRREHVAVVYMDQMCIYGGYVDLKGPDNGMWMYDFTSDSWNCVQKAKIEPCPPGRYKHAGVVYNNIMWVSGGLMGITDRNQTQVWTWNFNMELWTQVKTKGVPYQLFNHAVSLVGDSVLVFGGSREDGQPCCKLWRVDLEESTWKSTQTWQVCLSSNKVQPSPCSSHCLVLLPIWRGISAVKIDQSNKVLSKIQEINNSVTLVSTNENKLIELEFINEKSMKSLAPSTRSCDEMSDIVEIPSPKSEPTNLLIDSQFKVGGITMFTNPMAIEDNTEGDSSTRLTNMPDIKRFSYNMSVDNKPWKTRKTNKKFQTTSFIETVGQNNESYNEVKQTSCEMEPVVEKTRSNSMAAFIENAKVLESVDKSLEIHKNFLVDDEIRTNDWCEVRLLLIGGKLADSSLNIERPLSIWECNF